MSKVSKMLLPRKQFQAAMMELSPIGFMKSVFTYKNGTPRQSFICPQAKGSITIEKSVYNNPHHSLQGLQEYSHVWILFIFNQNNNTFSRAKVRPPRLGGEKLGIFATRSPYRHNPIGLTLAKLDEVKDDTVYVSGIDILDGTPIIDIKPYIPDYDNPLYGNNLQQPDQKSVDPLYGNNLQHPEQNSVDPLCGNNLQQPDQYSVGGAFNNTSHSETGDSELNTECHKLDSNSSLEAKEGTLYNSDIDSKESFQTSETDSQCSDSNKSHVHTQTEESTVSTHWNCDCHLKEVISFTSLRDTTLDSSSEDHTHIKTPKWLENKRHHKVSVSFSQTALTQIQQYSNNATSDKYRLKFLSNSEELRNFIQSVLENDPRSIYRKENPHGQLYFFTVDVVDITCWFDRDSAQVLRVRPLSDVDVLNSK